MTLGRPSLLKVEYCETVIELGKDGKSKAQMCAHFGVSRQTIDNWAAQDDELGKQFAEALAVALVHAQDWWENAAQTGLTADRFNGQVWTKTMQARFRDDYTERHEVSGPGGKPIETDDKGTSARELAKAVALLMAKGLKADAGSGD